ncbi:hypothetical protein ASE03_18660 [Kitasatospora sp. Root187]|nr:hypothetical protein ASC99_04740 [Kitasatospora sp. Root107]KRB74520.1 hypothetical protein ASE03_18660 [Kitasatospora sp. Root187]
MPRTEHDLLMDLTDAERRRALAFEQLMMLADEDRIEAGHAPVLVRLLREHIEKYGTAPDERLFQTFGGGLVQESSNGVVWSKAHAEALTPEQRETSLCERPYDWRHAGISGWLASGVAPAECARRAGHSIAVLHRVYAKCIHGDEERANQLIGQWLDGRARPAPESGP